MNYPCLKIDTRKILHNSKLVVERCSGAGISVVGVTKCFLGDSRIAECMSLGGISTLGDSRIENIKELSRHFGKELELVMLRSPMLSEIESVVDLCQVSLNTQLETISLISQVCSSKKKTHNIIVMVETDDEREGIFPDEAMDFCISILKHHRNITIYGLGTNARCVSKTGPSVESLALLCDLKMDIEKKLGISIPVISGGNSSIWDLLESGKVPPAINQVRMGEIILLGRETAGNKAVAGMHQDCFELQAEVIEVKRINGKAYRLILALGIQDVNCWDLNIKNADLNIVSQSSDHTILEIKQDLQHKGKDFLDFRAGDIISFELNYFGLLSCMTSPFVKRKYMEV